MPKQSKKSRKAPLSWFAKLTANKRLRLLIVAFVMLVFGSVGYMRLRGSSAETAATARARAVSIAKSELGHVAYDSRVLQYTQGNQEDWCADFVSWVFAKTGYPFRGGYSDWRIPLVYRQVSGVHNLRDYFRFFGVYKTKESGYRGVPGDVVILARNGASHTGIVVSISASGMATVEGNRPINGQSKVDYNLYSWTDSRIDGYGHWLH